MKPLSCLLLFLLPIPALVAAEEKPPPHQLRILPVGNRAPFKQELRDGVRYEVDPPEGSLPPRELTLGIVSRGEDAEERESRTLRLRLGEASVPQGVPAADDAEWTVTLRDPDSGKTWLKPALSAGTATTLVVWRQGTDWSEVKALPLDDSPDAVPVGTSRVVNVTPVDLGVTWGEKKLRLTPGKQARLDFPEGSGAGRLLIQYPRDGRLVTALDTMVENERSVRRQWIVFRADQAGARQPVQVLPLIESR